MTEQLRNLNRAVGRIYGMSSESVQVQSSVPYYDNMVVVIYRIHIWRPIGKQLIEESHPGIIIIAGDGDAWEIIRETDGMWARRHKHNWQHKHKARARAQ